MLLRLDRLGLSRRLARRHPVRAVLARVLLARFWQLRGDQQLPERCVSPVVVGLLRDGVLRSGQRHPRGPRRPRVLLRERDRPPSQPDVRRQPCKHRRHLRQERLPAGPAQCPDLAARHPQHQQCRLRGDHREPVVCGAVVRLQQSVPDQWPLGDRVWNGRLLRCHVRHHRPGQPDRRRQPIRLRRSDQLVLFQFHLFPGHRLRHPDAGFCLHESRRRRPRDGHTVHAHDQQPVDGDRHLGRRRRDDAQQHAFSGRHRVVPGSRIGIRRAHGRSTDCHLRRRRGRNRFHWGILQLRSRPSDRLWTPRPGH